MRSSVSETRKEMCLAAIVDICKQYDLSLSHQDDQGSFLIAEGFDEDYAKWLKEARWAA